MLIASFGSAQGYDDKVFTLAIALDPNLPIDLGTKPLRYGKLPQIEHVFKSDPGSPNILLTLIFVGGLLVTLPLLLGVVSLAIFESCVRLLTH